MAGPAGQVRSGGIVGTFPTGGPRVEVQETRVQTDRVLTIPNILSMARLVGVPVFLWLILWPEFGGPKRRRVGAAGPRPERRQRLPGRQARPTLEPDQQPGPDPRPCRRPPLHPLHPRRPDLARDPPALAHRGPAGPRTDAAHRGRIPRTSRLRPSPGELPGQSSYVQLDVCLPVAPAERRKRLASHTRCYFRMGVRRMGYGALLVGRDPLRGSGPPLIRADTTAD